MRVNPLFPTTHWPDILAAGLATKEGRLAFGRLCKRYQRAVLRYLTLSGVDRDVALDLRQQLYLRLMQSGAFVPGHISGTFSGYLRRCLDHLIADHHALSQKRGAGVEHVAYEEVGDSDAGILDHLIALDSFELALEQARANTSEGKDPVRWEALLKAMTGELEPERAAEVLGVNPSSVNIKVWRLRNRIAKANASLAAEVAGPDEVELGEVWMRYARA